MFGEKDGLFEGIDDGAMQDLFCGTMVFNDLRKLVVEKHLCETVFGSRFGSSGVCFFIWGGLVKGLFRRFGFLCDFSFSFETKRTFRINI